MAKQGVTWRTSSRARAKLQTRRNRFAARTTTAAGFMIRAAVDSHLDRKTKPLHVQRCLSACL